MDESHVEPHELIVAKPKAREPTRAEVLDEDVAALEEPPKDGGAVGRPKVQSEAPLVSVDRQVVGRRSGFAVANPWRAPAPRRIAIRWLDLDDIRTQIAQQHRAERPGQDCRAVDDAEARERSGRFGGRRRRFGGHPGDPTRHLCCRA